MIKMTQNQMEHDNEFLRHYDKEHGHVKIPANLLAKVKFTGVRTPPTKAYQVTMGGLGLKNIESADNAPPPSIITYKLYRQRTEEPEDEYFALTCDNPLNRILEKDLSCYDLLAVFHGLIESDWEHSYALARLARDGAANDPALNHMAEKVLEIAEQTVSATPQSDKRRILLERIEGLKMPKVQMDFFASEQEMLEKKPGVDPLEILKSILSGAHDDDIFRIDELLEQAAEAPKAANMTEKYEKLYRQATNRRAEIREKLLDSLDIEPEYASEILV